MISVSTISSPKNLNKELTTLFQDLSQEIKELVRIAPEHIVESVHMIRKRLKFLRAFVKLTQFCSENDTYKEINIVFRDCGRKISACRDAHVRGLLLSEMRETENNISIGSEIEKLFRLNQSQIESIEHQLFAETSLFDDLLDDIEKESVQTYFSTLEPNAETVCAGYALCYEKSYNSFHDELRTHESELLHEWRKRTKDLQYQQEILSDTIPSDLPPVPLDVMEICDLLGRINDLHMLADWIRNNQLDEQSDSLLQKLELENKSVQMEADKMGHRIYQLTPDQYRKELQRLV